MEPEELIENGQILIYTRETTGGSPGAIKTCYEALGNRRPALTPVIWGNYPVMSNDYYAALRSAGTSIQKEINLDKGNSHELFFGNHEGYYFEVSTNGNRVTALRTLYANEKEWLLDAMKTAKQK